MQVNVNVKAEDVVSFGAALTDGVQALAMIEASANHSLVALRHQCDERMSQQPMACTCGTGDACSDCPTPEVHA